MTVRDDKKPGGLGGIPPNPLGLATASMSMTTPYKRNSRSGSRDPAWPFVAALGLLLASAAGLAITIYYGDSQSTVWYATPWYWSASLALMTLALALAMVLTRRRLQHHMQTALVVSLIVHVLLAIYLKDQVLALILNAQLKTEVTRADPLPTIPDYYLAAPNELRPPQPFDRPTQASFQGKLSELERLVPVRDVRPERISANLAVPVAAVQRDELRRRLLSAPREATALSRRSRQDRALAKPLEQSIPALASVVEPDASAELVLPDPPTPSASRHAPQTSRIIQRASPLRRADLRGTNNSPAEVPRRRTPPDSSLAASGAVSFRRSTEGSVARLADATAELEDRKQAEVLSPARSPQIDPRTSSLARRPLSRTDAGIPAPRASSDSESPRTSPGTTAFSAPQHIGTLQHNESTNELSHAETSSLAGSPSAATSGSLRSLTHGARPDVFDAEHSRPSHGSGLAQMTDRDAQVGLPATDSAVGGVATGLADEGQRDWGNTVAERETGNVRVGSAAPSQNSIARSEVAFPTRFPAPMGAEGAEGAGGLGTVRANCAGLQDRRAIPRSDLTHQTPSRLREPVAGRPRPSHLAALEPPSRHAAAPFAGRIARHQPRYPHSHVKSSQAPSAQTEVTVERGLEYLAPSNMTTDVGHCSRLVIARNRHPYCMPTRPPRALPCWRF